VRAVPPASSEPIHLKPAAELAERVLLPGDPHRALAVATDLLEKPSMFNHHRGLWGYTGRAADGKLLSIQATGMGGPSAAIVIEELIGLGARRLIRIGTCGAFGGGLAIGDLLAVSEALAYDGASTALGAGEHERPDAELHAALARAAGREAIVASTDLFYDPRGDSVLDGWRERGAVAVEMECATLFRLAALRDVDAAAVLGVTDVLDGGRARIGREGLEELGVELGRTAYAALAAR
jgi:uridine phosphorylase